MKVKVLETGKIVEAKRFKNMTDEEIEKSVGYDSKKWCEENDIFIKPIKGWDIWRYMFDREVEILAEEEK